jgi:hypothetical protein
MLVHADGGGGGQPPEQPSGWRVLGAAVVVAVLMLAFYVLMTLIAGLIGSLVAMGAYFVWITRSIGVSESDVGPAWWLRWREVVDGSWRWLILMMIAAALLSAAGIAVDAMSALILAIAFFVATDTVARRLLRRWQR